MTKFIPVLLLLSACGGSPEREQPIQTAEPTMQHHVKE